MLIAPGNINRDIQSSYVMHKVWGLSQMIAHTWIRYVILGNFTEQNTSQNLISQGAREGDSGEPIQFSGVHGGIIKSGSQSPKSGHKTVAVVKIPHYSTQWPGSQLDPAPEMLFLSYHLHTHWIPMSSPSLPGMSLVVLYVDLDLTRPLLFSPITQNASTHTQQNWLIFVCNVNKHLSYFIN